MSKVIMSDEFIMKWAEALDLDPAAKIRRVVIDATAGRPLQVYVDQYGTDKALVIAPPMASGVAISVV